jgi:hypothetical protein
LFESLSAHLGFHLLRRDLRLFQQRRDLGNLGGHRLDLCTDSGLLGFNFGEHFRRVDALEYFRIDSCKYETKQDVRPIARM